MVKTTQNSLAFIKQEARQLVNQGLISPEQRLYTLWKFIPAKQWNSIERELENSDFILRDCIGDLIGWEE